ncbi:MAG: hypothetical protein ACRC6X_00100, partial [Culicoidibacterales bacterium]
YELASGVELPNIVIVIDNYDVVRDADFSEGFEALNMQVSREGASVGVHLVIGATSFNAIRMGMQANIKLKLVQFMNDSSDVSGLVGRSEFKIDEVAGRGLVKLDQPTVFQIGLPGRGDDELGVIAGLKAEGEQMSEAFRGIRPKKIPMVPEVLGYDAFVKIVSVQEALTTTKLIPLGVDFEHVEAVNWDMESTKKLLILGGNNTYDEVSLGKSILQTIKAKKDVFEMVVFDNSMSEYSHEIQGLQMRGYAGAPTEFNQVTEELLDEVNKRLETFSLAKINTPSLNMKEFFSKAKPIIVIITDIIYYLEQTQEGEKMLSILEKMDNLNICVVCITSPNELSKSYAGLVKMIKTWTEGFILCKVEDQSIFSLRSYREPELLEYEGYKISKGQMQKIKFIENSIMEGE